MKLKIGVLVVLIGGFSLTAFGQSMCPPRPKPGDPITNPPEVSSQNGVLTINLAEQSELGPTGFVHYCYVYMNGNQVVEAPTLRVNPGDQLVINFTNNITVANSKRPLKSRHAPIEPMAMGDPEAAKRLHDPCKGGIITDTTTNIHFHGLNIPPVCHQDEVVNTVIPNGGTQFQYSTQIPPNDQFGVYWYHPHPHGFAARQVYGGAGGAIIINGSNQYTQGLPERILMVRRNTDAVTDEDGFYTVNFETANYPRRPLPVINTTSQKEYWRVVNANSNTFLALQIISQTQGTVPVLVVSQDGIPSQQPQTVTTVYIPPAGRAEFVVPPLQANVHAELVHAGFDTGPIGDPMRPQQLANIVVAGNSKEQLSKEQLPKVPPPVPAKVAPRFAGLLSKTPNTQRQLYFSETNVGTNGPAQFLLTVQGQIPRVFDPMNPPAIKTKIGQIEDWTISNQTGEPHAFHIHQVHFLLLAINGQKVPNPELLDTVTVPPLEGSGPYPSVTVRMDFSDPNIAGTFVYHCHILDHEDGGMMAAIEVDPN